MTRRVKDFKSTASLTCTVNEFILNLVDETRSRTLACRSKPLFSWKGSCLGFPTLTQKFTLAHGSRKPTGSMGGKSRALNRKDWWKNRKNIFELLGVAEFHWTGRSFKNTAWFANFVKFVVVLSTLFVQLNLGRPEFRLSQKHLKCYFCIEYHMPVWCVISKH